LFGAITLFVILIGIVAFFAFHRPEALRGMRPVAQANSDTPKPDRSIDSIAKHAFRIGVFHSWFSEKSWFGPEDDSLDHAIGEWFSRKNVHILRKVTSRQFREELMKWEFDLVHVDAPVADDAIYFDQDDTLSSDALGGLLSVSKTKILVLPN